MVLFKKEEFKLLWPAYLALFIGFLTDATRFIFVIYFIQKGFTIFQTSIFLGVLALGVVLFEIPTGAIADTLGRKTSVILGWILAGLMFMLIPLTNDFYLICLILAAHIFTFTMISGADEAWIVDLLKKKKLQKYQQNFYINANSIKNLGLFIAGILGTIVIGTLGMDWTFYFGGGGMIIGGLVYLILEPERKITKKTTIKKAFIDTWKASKQAIIYIKKNKVLSNLTIASFFIGLASINYVAWQPYFVQQNISVEYFALLGSLGALIAVGIPHLVTIIKKKYDQENIILSIFTGISSIVAILTYFISGPIYAIIAFITIYYVISNLLYPIEDDYFQRHSVSKLRATLVSTSSMAMALPGFFGFLFGGAIADWLGPVAALAISGIISLPAIYFYLKAKK